MFHLHVSRSSSLRGRRLKGKEKGVLGARERSGRSLYQFQVHGRAPRRTGIYDQKEQLFTARKFHFCSHRSFRAPGVPSSRYECVIQMQINSESHQRVGLALQATVETRVRNKILRPANSKYHYSYLFFYKINKGDLPSMYSCAFWCEFIDLVGVFWLLLFDHYHFPRVRTPISDLTLV